MITFLLDHFLLHLVGLLYYRRINAGGRIRVTAANIPCFTNFLIGRWRDPINLFTNAIRIIVVVIFLRLDADISVAHQTVTTANTFVFDPTDIRKLNMSAHSATAVGRRLAFTKSCRYYHDEGVVSFYPIVFDLEGGVTFETEYRDPTKITITEVDDTSLYCLSPKYTSQKFLDYVSVVGCSPNVTSCRDTNPLSVTVPKDHIDFHFEADMGWGTRGTSSLKLTVAKQGVPDVIKNTWNGLDVTEDRLVCARMFFRIKLQRFITCYASANLTREDGSKASLIEVWTSLADIPADPNHFIFVRRNPGPILMPRVRIADELQTFTLVQTAWGIWSLDYVEQTALIVFHSLVYKAVNNTFQTSQRGGISTSINLLALILALVCLVITAIAAVVITIRVRKDERPRFHTIDGLSSILREEDQPSGRSLVMGHTAVIGRWKPLYAREAQLGPIRQTARDAPPDTKLRPSSPQPSEPHRAFLYTSSKLDDNGVQENRSLSTGDETV